MEAILDARANQVNEPQHVLRGSARFDHDIVRIAIADRGAAHLGADQAGLFDQRDVPIASDYVCAIEEICVTVHVRSSWINAVSVTADERQICALAGLPFVPSA